jgi:hypothetical protein
METVFKASFRALEISTRRSYVDWMNTRRRPLKPLSPRDYANANTLRPISNRTLHKAEQLS